MVDEDQDPNIENDSEETVDVAGAAEAGKKRAAPESGKGKPPKAKKKKVYPKRAEIWKHFVQRNPDDKTANCRYCALPIGCDTVAAGTSAMKGHKARCKMFKAFNEKENQHALGSDSKGDMRMIKYDPQLYRQCTNQLVVMNELPFSFVESEGWKRFTMNMLPIYQTFSRKTSSTCISGMYLQEKEELKHLFSVEQQRVSLTTDIWVSQTTSVNYMVVTAHWIDENWAMQKRILSFKVVTDHKGDTIAQHLLDCIDEWGIKKVFTVTVDNAKGNDKALRVFRDELRQRRGEALVCDGEYIHMRCCAHILNLMVDDGLKRANPSVVAIRNAIKFVRSSWSRLKSFALRCESGKVHRGSLPLDVCTRWNSTYLMLTSALKLRGAFEKLLQEDKLYDEYFDEDDEKTKQKRIGPPRFSDWEEVTRLVKFLKIFYNCTLTFSASTSVTSSEAYKNIVNIERSLITKCRSSDEEIRNQGHIMRDKFDKYWDGLMNMNPLVIVASVFDPRNKMGFACLCIEQLYGKDTIESRKLTGLVTSVMRELYEEYSSRLRKPVEVQQPEPSQPSQPTHLVPDLSDDDDECEAVELLYNKLKRSRGPEDGFSELDMYLTEKTEDRVESSLGFNYDVLSWWKCNSQKYPILSALAKDILAIQISSVASESVFSTSGRVLDPYRSSLTPYMVEVLILTQQWLRCSFKAEAETASIMQMMEDVAFFESLDSRNAQILQ